MIDERVSMRSLSFQNFEFYQEDFEVFPPKTSAKAQIPMATAFLVSF